MSFWEMMQEADTIVAPITAPGHAGVAVVRLSGPKTAEILPQLSDRGSELLAKPRELLHCTVQDVIAGGELDSGLVVFFKAPHSFTGEDVAEFNLHGSPYLVDRFIENCLHLGVRLAEAGEFSKRAFLNGRLDLSQTEAIADLIAAESESQARVAREQLGGKLSNAISTLGEPLRAALAEIEAYIDFPEEDIDPENAAGWARALSAVRSDLAAYLDSFRSGRLYREGARVALVGLPNAGKSSLLNRLVGEARAIVTEHAGTTRDSIEERASIDGLYVRFFDTAGIAEHADIAHSPDEIEKLGVERSWREVEQADLVVFVLDEATIDFSAQRELFEVVHKRSNKLLVALNKCDLIAPERAGELRAQFNRDYQVETAVVSALTGDGLAEFKASIRTCLLQESKPSTSSVIISNRRHFEALKQADAALARSLGAIKQTTPPEFIAADVRTALGALDDIIGVTHSEEILGLIFSKFCIGK